MPHPSTATPARAAPPVGNDTPTAPADPALRALLSEMEALARIMPSRDAPGPEDRGENEEARFDNLPV